MSEGEPRIALRGLGGRYVVRDHGGPMSCDCSSLCSLSAVPYRDPEALLLCGILIRIAATADAVPSLLLYVWLVCGCSSKVLLGYVRRQAAWAGFASMRLWPHAVSTVHAVCFLSCNCCTFVFLRIQYVHYFIDVKLRERAKKREIQREGVAGNIFAWPSGMCPIWVNLGQSSLHEVMVGVIHDIYTSNWSTSGRVGLTASGLAGQGQGYYKSIIGRQGFIAKNP